VSIGPPGSGGPIWRADGKELLYLARRGIWSVEVTTTPAFRAGTPKLLFEAPQGAMAATPDAQRFLIDVPVGHTAGGILLNWRAMSKR
jgi:hypothetical protein